jgi:hypothetical protein
MSLLWRFAVCLAFLSTNLPFLHTKSKMALRRGARHIELKFALPTAYGPMFPAFLSESYINESLSENFQIKDSPAIAQG